jgi:Homeodomain-like domain
MPGPSAAPLALSARQRALLQRLRQRQTAPRRLVRRVAILLALDADPCVEAAARRLGLTRLTVRHWRDRWLGAADRLRAAEADGVLDPGLLGLIEAALDDAPRPGGPATFTPEQIVGVVAVACEPPSKSGRPIDHWTARELADEAKRRKIVSDISPRTVSRFLKTGRATAAQEPLLAQRQPG